MFAVGNNSAQTNLAKRRVHCIAETPINFTATLNVGRIANEIGSCAASHPLQVVRIVSALLDAASIPRPELFAYDAEHLVAAFGFVDVCSATRARFCIRLEKFDSFDVFWVAHMGVDFFGCGTLDFMTVRT